MTERVLLFFRLINNFFLALAATDTIWFCTVAYATCGIPSVTPRLPSKKSDHCTTHRHGMLYELGGIALGNPPILYHDVNAIDMASGTVTAFADYTDGPRRLACTIWVDLASTTSYLIVAEPGKTQSLDVSDGGGIWVDIDKPSALADYGTFFYYHSSLYYYGPITNTYSKFDDDSQTWSTVGVSTPVTSPTVFTAIEEKNAPRSMEGPDRQLTELIKLRKIT